MCCASARDLGGTLEGKFRQLMERLMEMESFGFVVFSEQILIAENVDPEVCFWLRKTVQIM